MIELILQKLGLKSIDDFNPLERETWKQWASILGKQDVTIEDLKKLLPAELDRAREELLGFTNTKEKDLYYKAYIGILEKLTDIIIAPAQKRDSLRSMLKQKYGLEN